MTIKTYSTDLVLDGLYHNYGLRRQYRSHEIARDKKNCVYCGENVKNTAINGGQFYKKEGGGTGYNSFNAHVACFEKALPGHVAEAAQATSEATTAEKPKRSRKAKAEATTAEKPKRSRKAKAEATSEASETAEVAEGEPMAF